MNLKDLQPKEDVKAGAPEIGSGGGQHYRNGFPKPPAHFFEFKFIHVIMLVPLVAMAISWWTTRESASVAGRVEIAAAIERSATATAAAVALQNTLMAEHTKRFEGQDKRFDGL